MRCYMTLKENLGLLNITKVSINLIHTCSIELHVNGVI